LQDVVSFLSPTLLLAKSMLKEIKLPQDFEFFGGPFFPFAKRVQVIGHQQKYIRPSLKEGVSKFILEKCDFIEELRKFPSDGFL
jgi:hypothetical protein